MAATLSSRIGPAGPLVSPSPAQFRATSIERGTAAWQVDAVIELQEAILAGRAPHLALVTADIEAATGKAATLICGICPARVRPFGLEP